MGLKSGSGRFPWRRKWQPTPVFLPGESQGQRSLAGYTVHGVAESDRTEELKTNAENTQSSKSYMKCNVVATVRNRKETMIMNIHACLLLSFHLSVVRSKLEITGAFLYHNVCVLKDFQYNPTEWHYLSGRVTQFIPIESKS